MYNRNLFSIFVTAHKYNSSRLIILGLVLLAAIVFLSQLATPKTSQKSEIPKQSASQAVFLSPLDKTKNSEFESKDDWYTRALGHIQDRTLYIRTHANNNSESPAKQWRANNQFSRTQLEFGQHKLRLKSSTSYDAGLEKHWSLQFSLLGVGESDTLNNPATVTTKGNKIEFANEKYSEWYINSRRGIEHGFSIKSLEDSSEQLFVRISVQSDLNSNFDARNQRVTFSTNSGKLITSYSKLFAYDARGQSLTTRMEYKNAVISLVVDVRNAILPITIDPIIGIHSWSTEGNQSGAQTGFSVAGVGDVNGDGLDDVAIAAPNYSSPEANEGAVFIFLNSVTGLTTTTAPEWILQTDQTNALLGFSVSAAGDVNQDGFMDIVVGSPDYSVGGVGPAGSTREGAAYLYLGSTTGMQLLPGNSIYGDQSGAQFGFAVAGAGDVNNDGFDDILVGAPNYSAPEQSEGRVYVYLGTDTGVSSVSPWTGEINQANAQLGHAVNGAGDINGDNFKDIITGAPGYDYNDNAGTTFVDSGAAFLYFGSNAIDALGNPEIIQPVQNPLFRLLVSDGARSGISVDGAGDVNGDGYADIIIGADQYAFPPDSGGAVGVMYGPDLFFGTGQFWFRTGDQASDQLGHSVAGIGDVNGDGYADIAIGAIMYSDPANVPGLEEGAVFVYHGSPLGISNASETRVGPGNVPLVQFGKSVAAAGDINSDGYADILVGAPAYSNLVATSGGAFLYEGRAATDLSVTITDLLTQTNSNTQLVYMAAINNIGSEPANRVTLRVTLQTGATFISAQGPDWACNEINLVVTCDLLQLVPLSSSAVDISVIPPAGMVNVSAEIFANIIDPDLANNSVNLQSIVNSRPVANPMPNISMLEDDTLTLLLDGTDIDDTVLSYNGNFNTLPAASRLIDLNTATGEFKFTPPLNFSGDVAFSYTVADAVLTSLPGQVSITVQPQNDRPVAEGAAYVVNEDSISNRILGFSDPDSTDILEIIVVTQPTKGTITLINPVTGEYEYKPRKDVFGDDFFTYVINDGRVDSNEARVDFIITEINDQPKAFDQQVNIDNLGTVTGQLTWEDVDNLAVTFSIVTQPEKGSIVLDELTGEFTYKVFNGSSGADSFVFKVNDGVIDSANAKITITLANNSVPSSPILLSPADNAIGVDIPVTLDWERSSDIDGDKLTYQVRYCTDQNFTGPACDPIQVAKNDTPVLLFSFGGGLGGGVVLLGIIHPVIRRRRWPLYILLLTAVTVAACNDAADKLRTIKPGETTMLTIDDLNSGSRYYWKVVVTDEAGASAESEVWSFTTATNAL